MLTAWMRHASRTDFTGQPVKLVAEGLVIHGQPASNFGITVGNDR